MGKSIIASLFFIDSNEREQSLDFLEKTCLMSDELKKGYNIKGNYFYTIELKESISIWKFIDSSE